MFVSVFFLFFPKCFLFFSNCQVLQVVPGVSSVFGFITFITSELKLSLIIKQKE